MFVVGKYLENFPFELILTNTTTILSQTPNKIRYTIKYLLPKSYIEVSSSYCSSNHYYTLLLTVKKVFFISIIFNLF